MGQDCHRHHWDSAEPEQAGKYASAGYRCHMPELTGLLCHGGQCLFLGTGRFRGGDGSLANASR